MSFTTAHYLCDGHFTSISACEGWEVMAKVQVFKKETQHTYTPRLG